MKMDIYVIYFRNLLIYLQILNAFFVGAVRVKGEDFEPLFKTAVPHFSQHEVVVPLIYKDNSKLISTFHQGGHLDDVVVKLSGFSRNFTLNLKINRNLFSKKYVIKNYSENGTHIERPHTHKQDHCFYQGSLQGSPHSKVAVSTCNGLSGYIHDGRQSYHIEPAFDIDTASHRLYRDSDSLSQRLTCGAHQQGHSTRLNETRQILHKNEVLHRMRRSIKGPYDSNTNTRYVELYLVNDYRTYVSNGRNLDHQIRTSQNIINIVSMLYQPFNIYIALVGMENWQQRDMFKITDKAHTTLENFLHYRKNRINPQHPNDNAQLITGTSFDKGVVGKAIKGTICTFQYSGGVNINLPTPGQTAATIAHEMGHNFGMDHDNYTYCQCKGAICIMAATSGGINTPTEWSSCSMASLQEAFEMGMDYCLRNKPDAMFEGPVCGNGFTEEGEECDCGLQEMCHNKCCNASTCKLTAGSECATGSCCDLDTCKPKSAATLCRAAVSSCDLPEFCWGNNQYCPDDVHLEDGMECNGGQSYCYKGKCRTHTGQCKLLWGSTGRVSDPVCFKHLNTNGSKHGNCGYNWTTNQYQPCLRDDVMCGLLHCVHQNEKLMFWKDNLAHATPATFLTIGPDTYICRGAMLDVGLDMPDPGMVPDGAKCGDRKICVDHKCQALSQMKLPTCSEGCSDRGVCNSRGHCHCNEGFSAPVCDTGGNGGSIDSGPIKISDTNGLLIALLVLFLVVLPLLGLAAFMTYRYRLELLAWWHARVVEHKNKGCPKRPSRPPPKPEQPVRTTPPPPYTEAVGVRQQTTPQAGRPKVPAPPSNERPKTPTAPPKPRPITPQPNRPNVPNKNGHVAVVISSPVLTGSTHKDGQAHIKQSPRLPSKLNEPKTTIEHKDDTVGQNTSSAEKPQESKSLFGDIFKRPNFTRSQGTPSPKPARPEEMPLKEIVTKREITREISNPILISTTDRRSKHLVKLENINVKVPPESSDSLAPPLPPHVTVTRSESENTHRNRPLPPRPLSMPESECGEDIQLDIKEARKSMVAPSRMPMRPPPPPIKPSLDRTRQTIEDAISRIDDIKTEIPSEYSEKAKPVQPASSRPTPQLRSVAAAKPGVHSKPTVSKSSSDSTVAKKPLLPNKKAATASKSDPKAKQEWASIEKPIFNPKARTALSTTKTGQSNAPKSGQPGSSKNGQSVSSKPSQSVTSKTTQPQPSKVGQSKTSKTSKPAFPKLGQSQLNSAKSGKSTALKGASPRKASTDSIDDDPNAGAASVSGLAKMFEGQKKPLLGDKKNRSSDQPGDKKPSMPQKPGKQIRSVNV